jgi:hypothetical protein
MDAYLMADHEGDLPTHLLNEGELGNRVRALATLHGPKFPRFVAVEAPDEASLEKQIAKLELEGYVIKWRMVSCIVLNCQRIVGLERVGGSNMPPMDHVLFEIFETTDSVASVLDEAEQALRADGKDGVHVCASTDGNGSVLVELGSDDADLLATTAAKVREAIGASSGEHRVTGEGIRKL